MPKTNAEKLAIEAHASYIIIRHDHREHSKRGKSIALIIERAALRLYRRYHFAFGS